CRLWLPDDDRDAGHLILTDTRVFAEVTHMGAMASVRNVRSCVRGGALMLAAALLLGSTPSQASLVANGSFEAPISPAGSYINYPAGSTAITGWRVVGVDSAVVSTAFVQSGITFQAQHGNQWIDLAGVDSNS